MKPEIGVAGAQRREFRLGFLDAILAENPLTGGERGLDRFNGMGLRHRNQGGTAEIAQRRPTGGGDLGAHTFEIVGNGGGVDP